VRLDIRITCELFQILAIGRSKTFKTGGYFTRNGKLRAALRVLYLSSSQWKNMKKELERKYKPL